MRRTAILTLALALLMVPAQADADTSTRTRPICDHGHGHGGATFAPLIRRAWAERKWERRDPVTRDQALRIKHHRRCAHTPRTLDYMIRAAKRQREQFWDHRRRKLAQQATADAYGDIDPPGEAYLYDLRMCESGGNYATNTGNGYYGAYQFDLSTWASVGGSGYPHTASPAEQDYRAAGLYRARGSSPWPVCG